MRSIGSGIGSTPQDGAKPSLFRALIWQETASPKTETISELRWARGSCGCPARFLTSARALGPVQDSYRVHQVHHRRPVLRRMHNGVVNSATQERAVSLQTS